MTPLNDVSKYFVPARHAGHIARARFRRTAFNHRGLEILADEDVSDLEREDRRALQLEGLPSLKREDLAAFEIDFARPQWSQLPSTSAPTIDSQTGAVHIGWIEVLIARRGKLSGAPRPDQSTLTGDARSVPIVNVTDPPVWVWKQSRRLIVPHDAKPKQLLHAAIPLQIEADAPSGLYDVWTRLARTRDDQSTLWQRTDVVQLAHR